MKKLKSIRELLQNYKEIRRSVHNFKDKDTFISDYRVKDIQRRDAQIIVKTASDEYYTAPYTREDLNAIRNRMIQEYFDVDAYEIQHIFNSIFFGISAIFSGALLISLVMILVIYPFPIIKTFLVSLAVLTSGCTTAITLSTTIKSLFDIITAKKIKKDLNASMLVRNCGGDIPRTIKNNEIINIRFDKKAQTSQLISFKTSEQESLSLDALDEMEYTKLTQISKSESRWQILSDYNNHHEARKEESHARRKKRTKINVNRNVSKESNVPVLKETRNVQNVFLENPKLEEENSLGLKLYRKK